VPLVARPQLRRRRPLVPHLVDDGLDGAVGGKGEPGTAARGGPGVVWARARARGAGRGPGRPRDQGITPGIFGVAVRLLLPFAGGETGFLAPTDDAAVAVSDAGKASVLGAPTPDPIIPVSDPDGSSSCSR
jgi:hypothetical protein